MRISRSISISAIVVLGAASALIGQQQFWALNKTSNIKLVTFGDSITSTTPAGNCSPANTQAGNYSVVLQGLITARQGKAVNLTQVGLSGSSWNYNGTGSGTLSAYLPGAVGAAAGLNTKLVLFAGTNGLVLGSHTAAQEYSDFQAVLSTLLGEGYVASNIAVVGMLPRQTFTDSTRLSYNSLLAGGASTYGYTYVATETNFDIGYAGQQNVSAWFCPDNIHPTTTDAASLGGAHTQLAYMIYDALYPGFNWTPASAYSATLRRWYDAQSSSTITQSGGLISAWADKTSNGQNLTQATGSLQPSYAATGLNGHPAIQFDGTGRLLHATIAAETGNNVTAFAVVQASTTSDMLISDTSTNDSSGFSAIGLYRQQTSGWQISDNVDSTTPGRASSDTTAHSIIALQARSTAIQQANLFLDGSFPLATSFPAGNAAAGTPKSVFTITGFQVGKAFGFGGWNFNGYIGELGNYGGRLAAYDQIRLYGYMKAKWGTP